MLHPEGAFFGADIYSDQFSFTDTSINCVSGVADEVNKPWWLVETGGSYGPPIYGLLSLTKQPSNARIKDFAGKCKNKDVAVMGWYKLWGEPPNPLLGIVDVDNAYNIWVKPGKEPEATYQGALWWKTYYWETIRDIWD